jgi:hypothetical protein|tara:strand:- start:197 stop:400 length:204 start_codon:yes stop_codon:yes gene_type:complete
MNIDFDEIFLRHGIAPEHHSQFRLLVYDNIIDTQGDFAEALNGSAKYQAAICEALERKYYELRQEFE